MQTYLVGGAVRDQLLNLVPTEHDWVVVGARPEDLLEQGYKPVGKDFPVFIHPVTGDEYALARTERKSGSGYTGFICHSSPDVTLEEDLLRRDLTINAIAQANDGTLIDPYGGQRDLKEKRLRHVSDAFIEDPLRVLRTARFAARFAALGFSVAPETLALMKSIAESGELHHLVPERIWKETERALGEKNAAVYFRTLDQCDALIPIFPELSEQFSQHLDLLETICEKTDDTVLRLAYALHILPDNTINHLAERLRLPTHFRDACLTMSTLRHTFNITTNLNGSELLSLIEQLDALRRPLRMQWLCDIIKAINESSPLPTQLFTGLQIISEIKTDNLIAQGLKGKAIGEALRQNRLHKLQEYYS